MRRAARFPAESLGHEPSDVPLHQKIDQQRIRPLATLIMYVLHQLWRTDGLPAERIAAEDHAWSPP